MATLRAPMPAVISAIAELLLRLFGPSAWEALALTKLPSSSPASELLKNPWEQPPERSGEFYPATRPHWKT
jgi:hypothetical protein